MNTLSLIILGITVFLVLIGVVSGLKHGLIGSILRLATLVLSFLIAWFCRKPIAEACLEDGALADTLNELISVLPAGIGESLLPLLTIVLSIVVFVVVFLVLRVVSAIAMAVIGIFLPKGSLNLGAVIGIVQGALLAFCICVPINGLLLDAGNIVGNLTEVEVNGKPLVESFVINGEPLLDTETVEDLQNNFDEYADSGVSKFYSAVGKGYYKALSAAKIEGKSIVDYMDALVATFKFAGEIMDISNIDFSEGLTVENRDALQETFKNLNEIKGDMTEEAQEVLNDMISTLADSLGEEVPEETKKILEDFDMTKVDFEKEGDIVLKLYDLTDTSVENQMSATEIVNTLAESSVILPVMESYVTSETPIELPDEATKNEVISAIAGLQSTNPEAAASLNKIFGLNP